MLEDQAAALGARKPDVVALQEVTKSSLPQWRAELRSLGLEHVVASLDAAEPDREPANPRRHGVLLAAKAPLDQIDAGVVVPWPEVTISALCDGRELHVVHVPNSRNGWIKVETLEGLMAALTPREGLLCGDFNTPRSERPDGTILTFAQDRYGKLRPERGERWDRAERDILTNFWPDAYRELHGYDQAKKTISWNWPRFRNSGYRLDHVFTTYAVQRCEYIHEVRKFRLSDHSAMEVDL